MNFTTIRFLILLISLCPIFLVAQNSSNTLESLKITETKTTGYVIRDSLKTYNSEYDWFFSHLFFFYKKFISSQDASSCSFTPSCSEYAMLAIKKQGFFVGYINFWDRFSRCNGMSGEDYPFDEKKKLLIDPVKDWHYEE